MTGQKHTLITNYLADLEAEIDLYAYHWKLPISIEDADLTFASKPLSAFCEEDRQQASRASHLVSITLEQGSLDNLPDHFIKGNAPSKLI
jgi:hypothetical protein